jgi:hypothetical protein
MLFYYFHTFSKWKWQYCSLYLSYKKNSVALVRERTIPTEWLPPVGKVSANFLRIEGVGEVSANFLRIEGCHVVSATDPRDR